MPAMWGSRRCPLACPSSRADAYTHMRTQGGGGRGVPTEEPIQRGAWASGLGSSCGQLNPGHLLNPAQPRFL